MAKTKLFIPISFLLLTVEAAHPSAAAAGSAGLLYSLERSGAILHKVDADDGSTISSVTITLAGETVTGGTALAEHPTTGVLYAIVKLEPKLRRLVTINRHTGVATLVGDPGDAFTALAGGPSLPEAIRRVLPRALRGRVRRGGARSAARGRARARGPRQLLATSGARP